MSFWLMETNARAAFWDMFNSMGGPLGVFCVFTCGERKESSPDCDWSRLPSGLMGKINIGIKSYSYPTTVEDFQILPYWIIGS